MTEDRNKVWVIDFEDSEIIADRDEETECKISNEMEVVRQMLQDIRKGQSPGSCLHLLRGDIQARFHRRKPVEKRSSIANWIKYVKIEFDEF